MDGWGGLEQKRAQSSSGTRQTSTEHSRVWAGGCLSFIVSVYRRGERERRRERGNEGGKRGGHAKFQMPMLTCKNAHSHAHAHTHTHTNVHSNSLIHTKFTHLYTHTFALTLTLHWLKIVFLIHQWCVIHSLVVQRLALFSGQCWLMRSMVTTAPFLWEPKSSVTCAKPE